MLRRVLPAVASLLRHLLPNPRFGRVIVVTRAADVEHVLSDTTGFKVVYGDEMRDLGGGTDNVLSVDGAAHDEYRALLERSVTRDDLARVSEWVAADATSLLAAGAGRIDAMRDLITRTATEAACRLFGLTVHDPDAFGEWTMAVSTQLFGDFTGDTNIHGQARTASTHLRGVIDEAIARVEYNNREYPGSPRERETLIDRMITDQKIAPDRVRATIIGLVTAFVPTNTLAAGNVLEVLLDDRAFWRQAFHAAEAGDETAMRSLLLEAGRVNPALSPGLWRHVPEGAAPPRIGSGRGSRQTRTGDLVLACIPSALRDNPEAGTDPSARAWMTFGVGPHGCWGAEVALAHLTAVFMVLFRQAELRPARDRDGRMRRVGAFPVRLDLTYASLQVRRATILASLPVRADVPRCDVEKALDKLGNPARESVAATLAEGDRVQFASLSVIERELHSPRSILLLEVSGDGDEDDLLGLIARQCFDWLAPVVSLCQPADSSVADRSTLAAILRDARFDLDQRPFGKTGLHFDGLPELSVADIRRQEKVAAFARRAIGLRLKTDLGLNTRAMGALLYTRRLMRGDAFLALRNENARLQRLAVRLGLRGALLRPSRKRLAIAD